ncbi:hypothetical protein [Pelagibacterium sp. H642]|uniref:hypothetical protein n=1 Tax=Pelagibacterium sp. H642 TaxID=1881069 RepID=UPI00281667CB|nr:hypothetical protein [Pelagibacterium sp. H642]WMT91985.1 hypothetical protein NO934_06940 [Pelagibacterium sp. H642]
MKRRQLMTIVSLAAGLSVGLPVVAAPPSLENSAAAVQAEPQGFLKSGNPKAAGGPLNPGKGNPFNAY